MVDIVDKKTRSRMMSSIKGKNTSPELFLRKFLHAAGYRYRLHKSDLPGKPDLIFSGRKLAVFVHGCFWHRHSGCYYATSPASRRDAWAKKLDGNKERDLRQQKNLLKMGWRVLVVWECGLKHCSGELNEVFELIEGVQEVAEWPPAPPRKRAHSIT